jgi:hypothetical protein
MKCIAMQEARRHEPTPRNYILKVNGVAIDLSSVTEVFMHYRKVPEKNFSTIGTLDASPMLVVTNAAQGKIRFTPTASFWHAGQYELYFSCNATPGFNLPNTDLYIINVTEGV